MAKLKKVRVTKFKTLWIADRTTKANKVDNDLLHAVYPITRESVKELPWAERQRLMECMFTKADIEQYKKFSGNAPGFGFIMKSRDIPEKYNLVFDDWFGFKDNERNKYFYFVRPFTLEEGGALEPKISPKAIQ